MIAEAYDEIELREERQRRLNDIRYEPDRWLAATDVVLDHLERLNLEDVRDLPLKLDERIRQHLADLPEKALAELRGGTVQEVLDSVFAAQEALLRARHPWRELVDEEEQDDAG